MCNHLFRYLSEVFGLLHSISVEVVQFTDLLLKSEEDENDGGQEVLSMNSCGSKLEGVGESEDGVNVVEESLVVALNSGAVDMGDDGGIGSGGGGIVGEVEHIEKLAILRVKQVYGSSG